MSVNTAEPMLDLIDRLDNTRELEEMSIQADELAHLEEVEEMLTTTSTLDKDVVASVESAYPGLVLDNTSYDNRYTKEGLDICLEEIQQRKTDIQGRLVLSSLEMLDKLSNVINKLKTEKLKTSMTDVLKTSKTRLSQWHPDKSEASRARYMVAYHNFMGTPATKLEQVDALIDKLPTYKHPIQCLKEFDNDKYDKLFTPLLVSTSTEKKNLFQLYDTINNELANKLVSQVTNLQLDLIDIVDKEEYDKLGTLRIDMIPDELQKVLWDVIAALDVKMNPNKPLLEQTRKISSQLSKTLKVTDVSLRNKATVVNAIANHPDLLDKAFTDVTEITTKLGKFDKKRGGELIALKQSLQEMNGNRTIGNRTKHAVTSKGRQYSRQYRQLLKQITQLWDLVALSIRLSVIYVSAYSIMKMTLDEFTMRLSKFMKQTSAISVQQ